MTEERSKKTLKQLNREFNPDCNPLVEGTLIQSKGRYVSTGVRSELVNPDTGEVQAISAIHRIKYVDDAEFVKVFAEGVKAMYGLSRTAIRVFQAVLTEYQESKMYGGFADSVYLSWFDNGLSGRDVGMSEVTFHRGLKELLLNDFIAPKTPNVYWVNPALFFKGDRVAFIKEYRLKDKDQKTISARSQDKKRK